jgi:hypothetical protein
MKVLKKVKNNSHFWLQMLEHSQYRNLVGEFSKKKKVRIWRLENKNTQKF